MTNDEMKALLKQKSDNKAANMAIIDKHHIPYRQYNINESIIFDTSDGAVCFYLTTNKIQHRGKVYPADANEAIRYVKNIIRSSEVAVKGR